ncbi:MAG: cobalamin-dependent protein [Deltaproteobacteria bacterium]|nr:cobalamin-dependent protein [Deltaproteobacteria bacterium]
MGNDRKIRVLIAKAGCDIHERGPYTLMTAFRDAGLEVIYTGRYQSFEAIARAAIDEDVDLIALSDHTGSMPIIAAGVLRALEELGAGDMRVMAGGLIPPKHAKELEEMGVSGNFGPGTPMDDIIRYTVELATK